MKKLILVLLFLLINIGVFSVHSKKNLQFDNIFLEILISK